MTEPELDQVLAGASPVRADPGADVEFTVRFTEQEWRTLQLAPLWAFKAVSEADRAVSELETAALGRALVEIAHAEGSPELVRRVFGSLSHDPAVLVDAWRTDERPFDDGLRSVEVILAARATASDADAFRTAILDVAKTVGAAGGTVPEEWLAIGMVAAALGVGPGATGAPAAAAAQTPPVAPGPPAAPAAAPPTAVRAASPDTVTGFIATWAETIGGWVRSTAIVSLTVYLLVAWIEASQASVSVDREVFLASTPGQYLAPGLLYLLAPILLLIIGPWAMRPRWNRVTRSSRQALRTFAYQRRNLAGVRPVYRRGGYANRVAGQIALWVIGLALIGGVIIDFLQDRPGGVVNIGGLIAIGLTAAGLVGALLMLPSRRRRAVSVDGDGNITPVDEQARG